ncbi:MAG: Biotin carboxylase [Candidatus Anoxychlamydiales bacterium]|nr:Biotin carboxylase [Candidatus Anoxychlamydiales bacterium]NGX51777.1 Biotin carboxylase [Candidatus Anoxychlamydiales bacterium]
MKVLIANRGEIAVRIIRACHDLGLQTVAVYSKADSEALHVLLADEAICVGDGPSVDSYLKVANILSACEVTGADAIHPGYGFLSENAKFAAICESCNLNFIGPSHEAISKLGNKAHAKTIAKKAKCPVIPGTNGIVNDVADALKEARKIGFPLFIKASAGGGGKGIRVASSEKEFVKQFIAAQTEAEASFNNSDIYLEKMIMNPRHIEVQIIADKHGHIVHLGERDCSIQRRRQKLIEETPSPKINAHLRKKLGAAAVNIAKIAKYYSCGTVEFLLDEKNNYYFMEMNTRIQVEHTISEELTNVDLVKEQIKVAMGKRLSFKQKEIEFRGHVFEFRINAEDPSNNFQPSPGKLKYYIPPGGPNVRLDSACYSGYVIPPYYDSMIAKLIIKGKDRKDAIKIAKRALKEFHIQGVKSTIGFHLYMLEDEKFLNSDYNLNYIDDLIAKGCKF